MDTSIVTLQKRGGLKIPKIELQIYEQTLLPWTGLVNQLAQEIIPIQFMWQSKVTQVFSIGCLTAFYVVLIPLELIPSGPPHFAYVIV